jgi:hypothetical protein
MQQIGTVEEDGKVTINESSYEFLPSKRKKHTSLTPSCMTSSFVLIFVFLAYLGLTGFDLTPSTGVSFAFSGRDMRKKKPAPIARPTPPSITI